VAEFGQDNVYRVWGPNRYQTAYELAEWARGTLDFGMSGACIATGESYPDALTGAQLAGARYAPMILTSGTQLSLAAQDFCTGNEMEVRYITILGGPVAINQDVRDALASFLH
jgi:putative cell wall-binding protein